MKIEDNTVFSPFISKFQDRSFPEVDGELAGYSALINIYDLKVPLPEILSFISSKHKYYTINGWKVYTLRHKPENSLKGHLTFALKYEGINLSILNALFQRIQANEWEIWIKSEPLGSYSRRIWFLYEWLTGKELDIPNIKTGNFIDALNTKLQFGCSPIPSKRHRIRNNLPGTPDFCPLVCRTKKLDELITLDLKALAHKTTGAIHSDVLSRAAAFLLLKDSRASFSIEGENLVKSRAERWSRAISQAGLNLLSINELFRLQSIVIEDSRFVPLGFRKEGGFIGVHERSTQEPLPDHISARWQDIPQLIEGLLKAYSILNQDKEINPIIFAACIAFGFVFIHPFLDGNGRIHRYLIHHVLAEFNFSPKGIVFPISAVILERIDEYRQVLETYSRPRLEFIDWKPTENGNVEVLNKTIDLYRYFDATKMAEFLYECILETIKNVLPNEIIYLERYDEMKKAINEIFDMPNHVIDLLIKFLEQNEGKLSKRAKEKEFRMLSEQECFQLENIYKKIFLTLDQKD